MADSPPLDSSTSFFQKRGTVETLSVGDDVEDVFLLSAAAQGQARNGPYWRLDLRDATGAISGKIWSPQSQEYPDLASGQMVWLKGRVSSYNNKLDIGIETLRVLSDAEADVLDVALFLPSSPYNTDAMLAELRDLAKKTLTHKPWRKFISCLLANDGLGQPLKIAPAAKAMHHAYAGGLLEHTLSVAKLCLRIVEHYPQLDKQVLFAGAVCHDLGKIWELTSGLVIDYTQSGRLIGHIPLVLEYISGAAKKAGLEDALAEHLQHLILSHHGTLEFGSPKLPATAEALVLHYADNIDAKMQQVETALSGIAEGDTGWSSYNSSLERFLFRAAKTPEAPPVLKNGRKQTPASEACDTAAKPLQHSLLPEVNQCSLL